ncbi:MAG: threonine/serine exporter family protein, partial [Bdellovibrionales bacterium]|nr:threonine/serine exporter family protein [Bdellovibrionales bacterium]
MGGVTAESRVDFIMDFGRALHEMGMPAHRFEEALTHVSRSLGFEGQFFSVPTSIQADLRGPEGRHFRLLRVQPGTTCIEKLCELDELGDAVVAGTLTPQEGSQGIRRILDSEPRYGNAIIVACHGLSSAAIAVFFQAGFSDLVLSLAVGLMVGAIGVASQRFERMARLQEAFAAFMATLLVSGAALLLPRVSVPTVVLAGLISLLPGLTLTTAMTELATNNLVSGTARLMHAATTLLKLIFGAALGTRAAEVLGARPWIVASAPIGAQWIPIALAVAALTSVVLYRARPRDAGWIASAGVLAYLSAAVGIDWLGPRVGVFVGGWAVGAASNLFARVFRRPASVTLLPGLLLLVPGSLGFRSLSSLFEHDVV